MKKKGFYIAIGVGVGTALGVALNDMPTWIAVGAAVGLAIAGISGRRKKEENQ